MLALVLLLCIDDKAEFTSEEYLVKKLFTIYADKINELSTLRTKTKDSMLKKEIDLALATLRKTPQSVFEVMELDSSKVGDVGVIHASCRVVRVISKSSLLLEYGKSGIYFVLEHVNTDGVPSGDTYNFKNHLMIFRAVEDAAGYNRLRILYSIPERIYKNALNERIAEERKKQQEEVAKKKKP